MVSPNGHKFADRYHVSVRLVSLGKNYVMLRCSMTVYPHESSTRFPATPAGRTAEDERSGDARVYRSKVHRAGETDDWIVEPPQDRVVAAGKMVFTGSRAQQLALTYAFEQFGNARFFPY
jgi:hypothetical protein